MELKINVYNDCESEEPSKTYVVRRILFKTAKDLATIQNESSQVSDDEQEEYTLRMLQTLIPSFTKEDLDGIDPIELGEFFRNVGAEVSKVVANAQKN